MQIHPQPIAEPVPPPTPTAARDAEDTALGDTLDFDGARCGRSVGTVLARVATGGGPESGF